MATISKFDCHSIGVADALAEVLNHQGWRVKVLGSAVLSDLPPMHASSFCSVLVKMAPPSREDLNTNLGH